MDPIVQPELAQAWGFIEPFWPESVWLQALIVLGIALGLSLAASLFLRLIVGAMARRTKSMFDDHVVQSVRRPIALSIVLYGTWWAFQTLRAPDPFPYFVKGLLYSCMVVIWTYAARQIIDFALEDSVERSPLVKQRTIPVFKMAGMAITYGGGGYLLFLAWDLDLTAWIASAGIAGIAIGFAAQDTLANLFAGIAIIADSPYKLGDYIVIADTRGKVVHIGMRSTRVLTNDNVEIVIPNSTMASGDLVNESGGDGVKTRVSTTVEAAYGSDLDKVRETLLSVAGELPHVLDNPSPVVHFTAFGASGLVFNLRVWISEPHFKPTVLDLMNDKVYRAFKRNGVSIPYQTVDVNLFERSPQKPG